MPVRPRRIAALAALPTVIMTGVGVAVAAGPSGPATGPARSAATTPAYVGSAYGIKAQLSLAGGTLLDQLLPEIVKFPSGGDKSVLELPTELSETATLKVLNANSAVKKDVLRSNARTAGLSVLTDLVTAAVLNADCTADGDKVDGDGQVTDLRIAGIKVPVDPGPNFKVEIPKELQPFLSGGIWVDRQDKLKDGTLRVRALQVRLVIDPLGLQSALESLVAEVRAAAEKVVAVVEQVTGETIEAVVAKERAARGLLPAAPATDGPGTARNGTASARDDLRAEHAARQARAAQAEREAVARQRQAAEAERRAAEARSAAQAASAAGSAGATQAGAAEAGARTAEAGAEAAGSSRAAKADRAAVAREQARTDAEAAAGPAAHEAAAEPGVERKRDAAGPQSPADHEPTATEQAGGFAAGPAAEADAAQAEAEAQRAAARAAAARTAADEARARADAAAVKAPAGKADRADATAGRPAAAPAADPAEDDEEVGGTLGVQVIVSQVTCKGAKVVTPAAAPPAPVPDEPEDDRKALPDTGGDGKGAADLGIAGLALLVAGSAAVYVTRRRGRHAR